MFTTTCDDSYIHGEVLVVVLDMPTVLSVEDPPPRYGVQINVVPGTGLSSLRFNIRLELGQLLREGGGMWDTIQG